MKILTLDNRAYTLEKIPEWVDENLRFAVLDNSDPENPDFFYIPLIFLDFPKIKSGQMLSVPLTGGSKPVCAYFVKDISRQCEQVDYGNCW